MPGRSGEMPVPDPARLRDDVRRQLEHELGIIAGMGYADYFLVVADIVRYARQEGIPTCGRGSAANSVVAYTLGLTHVDPLAHDLYFERFLNQGRSDAPDVDIDFSWRDRDRVLEYAYRTYGEERVAMIATLVTFQGRAAVREVAKVHGLPEGEIAEVTKRLGWFAGARQLREKIATNPRFRGIDLTEEPWNTVLAAAEQLDDFPRHLGVHPGGIVIAPGRMTDHVPVERATKGLVITQWDMYPVEDAGLVKIDLLGNRSLAVIEDACNDVDRFHGHKISYVHFNPTEDRATRVLVGRGDTVGCFYVESPATRGLLRKLDCDDFDTLVAASSIIRPGVSSSGMMQAYIERHNGAPFTYLHPKMEELLGDTYGVMCYQEDVIKVAHHFAGLDLGEADVLRRVMSGKSRDGGKRMRDLKAKFFANCKDKG
ncbi:MAG: DNA polymerase III subunit alpha, partial [Planctomycetes bacterium]|nr:DNA polymerase III subunit alpha [Planctomycetota bacterium]